MRGLAACCAVLWLAGCGAAQVEVDARDPRLRREAALLLYAGKPFDGVVTRTDPVSGARIAHQPYRAGLLDGVEREWHAGGQRSTERPYRAGRKVGRHRAWWPDGRPRFEYPFLDGEFHGEVRSWYANGLPAEQREYRHGHEHGAQRTWFADGSARANYYYLGGRRYGSIGTKLCINEPLRRSAAEAP